MVTTLLCLALAWNGATLPQATVALVLAVVLVVVRHHRFPHHRPRWLAVRLNRLLAGPR